MVTPTCRSRRLACRDVASRGRSDSRAFLPPPHRRVSLIAMPASSHPPAPNAYYLLPHGRRALGISFAAVFPALGAGAFNDVVSRPCGSPREAGSTWPAGREARNNKRLGRAGYLPRSGRWRVGRSWYGPKAPATLSGVGGSSG